MLNYLNKILKKKKRVIDPIQNDMKTVEFKSANPLAVDNEQTALETIDEFFRIFHLVEAQEEVSSLQQIVLKDDCSLSKDKAEELVYFCDKLKELIAAAIQFRKTG